MEHSPFAKGGGLKTFDKWHKESFKWCRGWNFLGVAGTDFVHTWTHGHNTFLKNKGFYSEYKFNLSIIFTYSDNDQQDLNLQFSREIDKRFECSHF